MRFESQKGIKRRRGALTFCLFMFFFFLFLFFFVRAQSNEFLARKKIKISIKLHGDCQAVRKGVDFTLDYFDCVFGCRQVRFSLVVVKRPNMHLQEQRKMKRTQREKKEREKKTRYFDRNMKIKN